MSKTENSNNQNEPTRTIFLTDTITTFLTTTIRVMLAVLAAFAVENSVAAKETESYPHLFSNSTPVSVTQSRELKLLYKMKGHGGTVKSLGFSPDSKTVVSGGGENDATIRLWDVGKGKARGVINRAHRSTVHAVLVSPNGQTLASGSSDTSLNLWNLRTNRFTKTFVAHTGVILALAVTPDSKMLVSAATDGVRAWDLIQQRSLGALVQFDNYLHAVTLSPDGKLAATGDRNGVVKLWNIGAGKEQLRFSAHTQTVTGVVFIPNGEKLVTTSRDRKIKIWDLMTGKLLRTLSDHDNWVNAIAIHPDGEILASAGRDGIKLWNLRTGELLANLYEHQDWVSAIAFSPNGKYLASGGFDKAVYLWEIPEMGISRNVL